MFSVRLTQTATDRQLFRLGLRSCTPFTPKTTPQLPAGNVRQNLHGARKTPVKNKKQQPYGHILDWRREPVHNQITNNNNQFICTRIYEQGCVAIVPNGRLTFFVFFKKLLESIAKVTGGMYVMVHNMEELSTFFKRQVLLSRFIGQFSHGE